MQSEIRILYVEDEPFLAKIVTETLEGEGFAVELISDGAYVLKAFRSFEPQLVVLDVMLPNVDGFSLAREIRKLDESIPIIFLTAKNQTKDLVHGFGAGGNDYIKKPFSMEELIIRINNLLSLSHLQRSHSSEDDLSPVQIGRYTFYPQSLKLIYAEEEKRLSHRESEILKMLTQNINGVTKRKDLLMHIWGDDSIYNSRNLDVYIRKIRHYLEKDQDIEIITLKGVGYQFGVTEY